MPRLVPAHIDPGSWDGAEQPVLTSGPLVLRPWLPGDAGALVAAYEDPGIQRWHVRSMTMPEARRWIARAQEQWSEGTGASWAVLDGGEVAGRLSFSLDLEGGSAGTAYWIVPSSRGRGLASGALRCTSDWALARGLHRIDLEHSTRNPASCRVAERAGFLGEGVRRSAVLHADGWHDMHVHARLAPEPAEGAVPAPEG